MQNVEHINREVHETDDLAEIRTKVAVRLASITEQAREFRARQESRFLEQSALAQKMATRVAALERQTSELHRSLHQEQARSQLDALTGVPNRGALDSRMLEEINRWKRFRDPVTVLVWDLDRFKSINDTYGHRAGDRVLQEVAKCFAARIRATDVLARFGGEEFVMLLVGTQMAEASKVANELRESVAGLRFHFRDTPVKVTASCGMTELRDGDTAESVFDRADAALYKAKDGGRNLCIAA
jgi:diguanylate cyclase